MEKGFGEFIKLLLAIIVITGIVGGIVYYAVDQAGLFDVAPIDLDKDIVIELPKIGDKNETDDSLVVTQVVQQDLNADSNLVVITDTVDLPYDVDLGIDVIPEKFLISVIDESGKYVSDTFDVTFLSAVDGNVVLLETGVVSSTGNVAFDLDLGNYFVLVTDGVKRGVGWGVLTSSGVVVNVRFLPDTSLVKITNLTASRITVDNTGVAAVSLETAFVNGARFVCDTLIAVFPGSTGSVNSSDCGNFVIESGDFLYVMGSGVWMPNGIRVN